jgi:hypothetical protein
MKKVFILLFIFISSFAFSQSWTEDNRVTWTVITKENWERLKAQYEEDYGGGFSIDYVDSLEIGITKRKVTSGTRPNFNGFYYLLGDRNRLAYGNSNTGRIELDFYYGGDTSEGFIRRYNLYIGRVNGQSTSSTQSVSPKTNETNENSFEITWDPQCKRWSGNYRIYRSRMGS